MKINTAVAVIIGLILVTTTATSIFFVYKNFQGAQKVTVSSQPQIKNDEQTQSSPINAPTLSPAERSYITGRLCYPSESIPAGKIIAKNITNEKLFSQEYHGTEDGSPDNYTLEVDPGTYYLKFETKVNGYYTNYKVEDGTGDHNLKPVVVKSGESLPRIDICDFYYPQNEEPKI